MTLTLQMHTLGLVATNAYLLGDDESGDALLIDPVDDADYLLDAAQSAGWNIRLILATHAHFDHVLASAPLKAATGAPFALHADAAATLPGVRPTTQMLFGIDVPEPAEPDRLLTTESELIEVAGITLRTLYTPGHAPGHLSYYLEREGIVFSGDALFAGSIGRTDLPGGSEAVLLESIRRELLSLPDDVRVFPGHGEPTTIGHERQTNPYLAALR